MKKPLLFLFAILIYCNAYGQEPSLNQRILDLENQVETIQVNLGRANDNQLIATIFYAGSIGALVTSMRVTSPETSNKLQIVSGGLASLGLMAGIMSWSEFRKATKRGGKSQTHSRPVAKNRP